MALARPMRHTMIAVALAWLALAGGVSRAGETRVAFDIPDKIECRDVTPEKCAAAHPTLKVIEAKFRISASFIEGSEDSIVDFVYMITSPDLRMKIQDYLPNTTLESTLADDQIEVADTTENSEAIGTDAHVAYHVLTLGATKNQTAKKTESDHYKRLVSKALVLASGTTNREHGVFFKLRPSKGASLEGGKEFTFLAIVPKSWRGDWCKVCCGARATKKSLVSSSVTLAGIEQASVGFYLSGDREASDLAEALCQLQEANGGLLSKEMAKDAVHQVASMHAADTGHHAFALYDDWLRNFAKLKPSAGQSQRKLEVAKAAIADLQTRLGRLSGAERIESAPRVGSRDAGVRR